MRTGAGGASSYLVLLQNLPKGLGLGAGEAEQGLDVIATPQGLVLISEQSLLALERGALAGAPVRETGDGLVEVVCLPSFLSVLLLFPCFCSFCLSRASALAPVPRSTSPQPHRKKGART